MDTSRAAKILGIPVSTAYAWRKRSTARREGATGQIITAAPPAKAAEDERIQVLMRTCKAGHPYWGYRRVRAWLRRHHGIRIGRKRANRLLREAGLLCTRFRYKPKRRPVAQPQATAPRQAWQIDMTSLVLSDATRLFLVLVLDVFTRKIVGRTLSRRCRAREWTQAIDQAVLAEFPDGVRGRGLVCRSDNGCQPTSRHYIQTLETLQIAAEFTAYSTLESNAYVERVIRTIKEDGIWPFEFETEQQAKEQIARTIREYNRDYPHSSLNEHSPEEFEELWRQGRVKIERYTDAKGRERTRVILSQNAA